MKLESRLIAALLATACCNVGGIRADEPGDIVLENMKMRLVLGADASVKSLKLKPSGEELADPTEKIPLFTTTQERPFNNEIKLIWPHKRTTWPANRLRREGNRLIAGFEIAPYEAVVEVTSGEGYFVLTLEKFNCVADLQYEGLSMDTPPVAEFRVAQLPVRNRRNVGDWLNVVWDDAGAAAVVGADPLAIVGHDRRNGVKLLYADLRKGMSLTGGKAAIVAGAGRADFLASMEALENDLDLPRGVASRRDPRINASIYWTSDISPENVDSHIALAKRGGFRMMLIYYPAMIAKIPGGSYHHLGDYDWNDKYPNGQEDLRRVLGKLRAAGITPGFHTLQTHIGCKSRYVTPVADPRLNLTRHFTLAKQIPAEGEPGEVEVLENPVDAPRHAKARVLKFGGELFSYEAYTATRPYKFTGVRRGYWETAPAAHPRGEIGGTLDVSEYFAISCYIDQRTDLQDEVGEKIAKIYDAGMSFCYFDGSEGVNPPCGVNVALSQLRVVSKFASMPIFTEGAAKSHFGWHLQAGANAFDVFPPEIFKKMIVKFPQEEAPIMSRDFTRLDFGWWALYAPGRKVKLKDRIPYEEVATVGTQMDMWEFGTSRAAAWNCPATVMLSPTTAAKHPRIDDLLEVMRRWEDVRANNLLTPEWREALKSPTQEHHLFLDENKKYELHEISMLPTPANAPHARGFVFERRGKRVVACWHTSGSATFDISLDKAQTMQLAGLRYIVTSLSTDAVKAAWAAAKER